MICSHCGAKIETYYKFCPSCGMTLTPSQNSTAAESAPEPLKKKRMPLWFKILSALAVIALIGVTAGILFTESLVDVIDNQLIALRGSNIDKAYYAYTSKEFQEATPMDEFRQFIDANPIFIRNQSAHFTQRSLHHNIGTIRGNLTDPNHKKIPVEYKLIKEDGKWKILSVRLLEPNLIESNTEPSSVEDSVTFAKQQLEDIRQDNVIEAYRNYTSKEFKAATSEDAFLDFVKRYPILQDYESIQVISTKIHEGAGNILLALHKGENLAYIKYYLIKEDKGWEIWSIRILSPLTEEDVPNKS